MLTQLAESTPPGERWRARLELARLARIEGRSSEAIALLQRVVDDVRGASHELGPAARCIERLVENEARELQEVANGQRRATPDGNEDAGAEGTLAVDPAILVRLIDFGRRLAAETDPDRVLQVVLREAIGLMGFERGFVVLADSEGFQLAAAEGLDRSEVEGAHLAVSRALVREALRTRQPVLVDLSAGTRRASALRSLSGTGVRAVACVPIHSGERALGALYLDRRGEAPGFAERGWCLQLFAGQAAAALENARSHRQLARALEVAGQAILLRRSQHERRARFETLVGTSDAMQATYRMLDRIVPTELPVVITGETGTGKDLVAHLIHERGPRGEQEFIAVNCAGLPESLLESELFGYERGAFTGAERARPGLFEIAHRGTLFLDEVADMSPRMQADLLRALQSGEVRRLGGRESLQVDVRLVAATQRDLQDQVQRGAFRQDLYFRLNVIGLRLPPLRERFEDIPLLVEELLRRLAGDRRPPTISPRALRCLVAYSWPGNGRELENVLRRLLALAPETVDEYHLPTEIRYAAHPARPGTLREAELEAVQHAMEATGGNKTKAARLLGIDRKTLLGKLQRLPASAR
jgi:transcriptional regulator with GAF, ATPase, and Fis domain